MSYYEARLAQLCLEASLQKARMIAVIQCCVGQPEKFKLAIFGHVTLPKQAVILTPYQPVFV